MGYSYGVEALVKCGGRLLLLCQCTVSEREGFVGSSASLFFMGRDAAVGLMWAIC